MASPRDTARPVVRDFIARYGAGPVFLVRAPGRVNLIGDHTDYNGGYVLPIAFDRDLWLAFRPGERSRVELTSLDLNQTVEFDLSRISRNTAAGWSAYPMGVAWALREEGFKLRGLRGLIRSHIPPEAGLASSAALEVATALALCAVSDIRIDRPRLARICRRAESDFVGMRCGIMDQFAALLCRKGHALFVDCAALSFELVPMRREDVAVVVCDTGIRRSLVQSLYNERRKECARAFFLLKRHLPDIETYRDLGVEKFKAYESALPEPLRRRARHVVTENARVLHAVRCLEREDFITFGALMDASHESLRKDFEVSCRELDLLVDLARQVRGTFGARITGAGFGGCTVNLVPAERTEEFVETVSTAYRDEIGRRPAIFRCRPADGATLETEGRS